MNFTIETEQETDGRWIAECIELSGVMVYRTTQEEAIKKVQALALRVIAEKIEHREITDYSFLTNISFAFV